jgi:hypothetical protein
LICWEKHKKKGGKSMSKLTHFGLIFVIVMMIVAIPASANIVYPDMYYSLGGQIQNTSLNSISGAYNGFDKYPTVELFQFFEQQRTNILLEKQNELLAEQNNILWIQTCYAPNGGATSSRSSWVGDIEKLKGACSDNGYPTRTG